MTTIGQHRSLAQGGGRSAGGWSGLRESNPSSWLGKPEHYHYAKPAFSHSTEISGPNSQLKNLAAWRTRTSI